MNFSVIILAAGSSSRMGSPKQLLRYKGKNFLDHVIGEAKNSNARWVIVVLGSSQDLIKRQLENANEVRVIINDSWSLGISSSIKAGLTHLLEIEPGTDGAIFAVCDQPFITTMILNELISTHLQSGKPIIASSYDGTVGTPALCSRELFPELLSLDADAGAKKIMMKHPEQTGTIPFPLGNIDIDNTENYESLKKMQ